ncbi:MAG: vitamin K epoxide reductase family protein [Chiayiivirga sp.]|jgi:uncharacterized membrane protein|uniref:vitamin K epoxide reductase family protein n=1 Tax=Chiayiivirga sp. TaxID=2041042 RepID=UPI0025C7245F|nr:vitamin K epoxide reductase family protein [Chiayiivirga sp.]MCI1729198.1 vitamin K epoxide reductase family protein [Chiayiivirga sp.]
MSRSRRSKPAPRPATPPARRPLTPDWITLALAAIGIVLTAYLTITALNQEAPAFCTPGSGCDVVQQSRWSTLFGAPMALWGMGLYLLLALLALFASNRHAVSWRLRWSLALVGVAISLYLTAIGWLALDAFCAWCLLSLALVAAIFVGLSVRRPVGGPGIAKGRFAANNAILLAAILGVVSIAQAGWLTRPADPRLAALAAHLDARGAKFYGASWCPNCQEQKDIFGRAADALPYVECSPNGRQGAIAMSCLSANVTAYPTWIIRGRPYQEVLQPEELARRSGFDWAGFSAPTEK